MRYLRLKRLVAVSAFLLAASLFGAGTATVIRVHPRLTRGLAREALFAIRFDNSYGGTMSDLHLSFSFTNCTSDVLGDLKVWYQAHNKPTPYFFREEKATLISTTRTASANADKSVLTATLGGFEPHIYPCVGSRTESDYIWVTATISPTISPDAEIRVNVTNETITLGGNVYTVKNGTAAAPHRVFPYAYQVGAYLRQDRAYNGSTANLENGDGNRVKGLTDILLINNFNVRYVEGTDAFDTTWDAYPGKNDTQTAAAVRALRDKWNPKCMVRGSLMRGAAKVTAGGVTGYPIAVAAANATYREQLVNAIIRVLEANQLDGLDIDWEYPGVHNGQIESAELCARDWGYYGLLLRDLSVAFFDRGWVLSICSNASGWAFPGGATVSGDTYGGVLHGADFINSMAYGDTKINAAPTVMQTAIGVLTRNGVPERRIVVGQAMYGYENGNPGWDQIAGAIPGYWGDDKTRYWDGDCLWNPKRTFEGPSSYHAKCNWCRENDLGGVMSWGYYSDVGWYNKDYLCLARHQARACWPTPYYRHPAPPKEGDTYLIDSEEDWAWLRENAAADLTARLTADITFHHDPLPINTWSGVLDGDGYTLTVPFETWLAHSDQPALIRKLTGTVKNLTIDFSGRVVSRASRWNDTEVAQGSTENTLSTPHTGHYAAVLAAQVTGSAGGTVVSNVTLRINDGAEVQGPSRTGGLFGEVWAGSGNSVTVSDCRVVVAGMIRTLARNTSESELSLQYGVAGAIAGNVNAAGSVSFRDCTVILEPGARIEVQTGTSTAAGGAFGNINNSTPRFSGIEVYAASTAGVSAVNGSAGLGATSYAGWNQSYAETVCAYTGRHTYLELAANAAEDVELRPAFTVGPEGLSIHLSAENPDGSAVALTKWAKPSVVFLDAAFAESETQAADGFTLDEDGAAHFTLPEPSVARNPCLFKVRLTAEGY